MISPLYFLYIPMQIVLLFFALNTCMPCAIWLCYTTYTCHKAKYFCPASYLPWPELIRCIQNALAVDTCIISRRQKSSIVAVLHDPPDSQWPILILFLQSFLKDLCCSSNAPLIQEPQDFCILWKMLYIFSRSTKTWSSNYPKTYFKVIPFPFNNLSSSMHYIKAVLFLPFLRIAKAWIPANGFTCFCHSVMLSSLQLLTSGTMTRNSWTLHQSFNLTILKNESCQMTKLAFRHILNIPLPNIQKTCTIKVLFIHFNLSAGRYLYRNATNS